jgi:hypothetical protein
LGSFDIAIFEGINRIATFHFTSTYQQKLFQPSEK